METRRAANKERMRSKRTTKIEYINAAFSYDASKDYSSDAKALIGHMSVECKHCHAKKWPGETPGMCCSSGKVKLQKLQSLPVVLQKLLTDNTTTAVQFRQNLEVQFSIHDDIFWC